MEGSDHRLKGANAGGRAGGGEPKQEGSQVEKSDRRWRGAIRRGRERAEVEQSSLVEGGV